MAKKRVAVVENPNAGKHSGGQSLAQKAKQILASRLPKWQLKLYQTPTMESLKSVTHHIMKRGIDVVIIMGGDGSMHHWLSHDLPKRLQGENKLPEIIIVSAGTFNTISKQLGLRGLDPLKTLAVVADKLEAGYELDRVYRNVLQINELYGFTYGTGFAAQYIDRYNQADKRGLVRAVKCAVGTIVDEAKALIIEPERQLVSTRVGAAIQLVTETGEVVVGEADYTGIIASAIPNVGLGFMPTYAAVDKLDHFHLIAPKMGFWKMASNLPQLFTGTKMRGDVLDSVVKQVVIKYSSPEKTIRMIDGEVYPADKFPETDVVSMGPRLAFIRS